jgi:hypothetical protein
VGTGLSFLVAVTALPVSGSFLYLLAIMVGKIHTVGAWIGMWKAGKLTKKYVAWMFVLTLLVSYWGTTMVSLPLLALIANLMFLFHFLFDEYDIQEESRNKLNLISGMTPGVLGSIFLLSDYFNFKDVFFFEIYGIIFIAFLLIELLYVKQIGWFFVQSKIFSMFILFAIFTEMKSGVAFLIFLIYHYIFWFIYPVYKLHKYKREERDGFIFILLLMSLLLMSFSMFYYGSVGILENKDMFEIAVKIFLIGTIVHILATAPFGYWFGLPRPHSLIT